MISLDADREQTVDDVKQQFARHMKNGNFSAAGRVLAMARPSFVAAALDSYLEGIDPSRRLDQISALVDKIDNKEGTLRAMVGAYKTELSRPALEIHPHFDDRYDE